MDMNNFRMSLSVIDSENIKMVSMSDGIHTAFVGVADNKAVNMVTSMDRMSQLLIRAVNNRTRERNYFKLCNQLLDKEITDEEFEKEIERGGEVALEQFWIQKSFCSGFNIRAGHIIVPIGQINNAHLPTQFFTVYRPEGENTIMPCTWHETGLSVWGRIGDWRYEAMVIPALNANMFNHSGWIHDGSASAYEFKVANNLAGAARIDNYSVKGLRMGISGYIGNSFQNDIIKDEKSTKYKDVKGTVVIGAFDFDYNDHNWVVRGNFDYGHLGDADLISTHNKSQDNSTQSPYPHTAVGKTAIAAGIEAGYDIFSQVKKMRDNGKKLYVFGRYEYYDSYHKAAKGFSKYEWTKKQRMAVGLNYYPMKDIVVKAEYSKRFLKSQYNNEPSFSLGIAYAGFFIK